MAGDNTRGTALVTGSTAGIGRAIALALAGEGYSVILTGRREESSVQGLMQEMRAVSGNEGCCTYVRGDISMDNVREEIINTVEDRFPALDLLVNNAGITTAGRKDMLDVEKEEIEYLFRVNLIAPFLLTRSLVPAMARGNNRSCIINISSLSAYTASVNRADYCMSKAGMSMMTMLFASRLASMNIGVFEIRPGIIRTDMTAPARAKYDALIKEGLLPVARWGEPDDVARAVTAIAGGAFPYSTGEVINVDGGFHIRRL